ncbi:MAG TPA: SEC-C metal-binding domain-containing protein [Spirochaetota bacterium]|nr:SEC-C metal-binding domain-containing protein [Spirochaetota bacterium]
MSHKVGRNDPCPCGSGKKYKKCCMEKADNVLRFPSGTQSGSVPNNLIPPLPGFDPEKFAEYQTFAESWDEADGPVPSFMQYLGTGNAASEVLDDLKNNLKGMDIKSEKQLQALADMHMRSHNNTPIDELLGLNPVQMRYLLDTDFELGSGAIKLSDKVDPDLYVNAPFILWTLWLFSYIEGAGEIQLSEYELLRDEVIDKFIDNILLRGKPHDEVMSQIKDNKNKNDLIPALREQAFALNVCFLFLSNNGYVKKRKGMYSLTAKIKKMIKAKGFIDKLFRECFMWMCYSYNWLGFYDYDIEDIQATLPFSLHIVHRKCQDFVQCDKVADYFFGAFGHIIKDNELSRMAYMVLFLDNFAELFGLIDIKYTKSKSGLLRNISIRESELAKQLFVWNV